jgi:hypothetical protein
MEISLENRVGDLLIDEIAQIENHKIFRGRSVKGKLPNCNIQSPWIDSERKFTLTSEGLAVYEKTTTKVRRIPIVDLQSQKFRKLRQELRACYNNIVIVFYGTNALN